MRVYWAIFSARLRMLLQYRQAALAGVATQFFWGLIRVMIFTAFYRSTTRLQTMSLAEVITYTWLGQALIQIVLFRADAEVAAMIRDGSVVYELARPVGLYRLWYARSVASRLAPTLLRMGPVFLLAGLFMGLRAPASWLSGFCCLASVCSALLLAGAMSMLLTISLLWTLCGDGINHLAPTFIWLFSGFVIPLPLMPPWLLPVARFLPFRGLADTPYRLYIGHIPPVAALPVIAHQLAWTAALILLGQWLLGRSLRRLVAQGG